MGALRHLSYVRQSYDSRYVKEKGGRVETVCSSRLTLL